MELTLSYKKVSFKDFLWPVGITFNKALIADLLITTGVYALIFVLYAYAYPYMHGYSDSETYLSAASSGTINGYRPYGYSWFIRLIHFISPSLKALFLAQFIFNAVANLVLLLTVRFLFKINRVQFYILAALLVFAPSVIFCTNYLMSDGLFNSLTVIFISTLIWIVRRPNLMMLIVHALVLHFAITVRYTALFYPIISIAVMLFMFWRQGWFKLVALIPIIVFFKIYTQTKSEYRQELGADMFSPFSGWVLANNATAIIPHINAEEVTFKDPNLKTIHYFVTEQPDASYSPAMIQSTDFIWDKNLAGKKYLYHDLWNSRTTYLRGWVKAGRNLRKYGIELIRAYPGKFIQHYLLPNTVNAFRYYELPEPKEFTPLENMKGYYEGMYMMNTRVFTFDIYPALNKVRQFTEPLLWFVFLLSSFGFWVFGKKLGFNKTQRQMINVLLLFAVCYIGFSIVSHPVNNFRYMVPIYAIKILVTFLVVKQLVIYRKQNHQVITN